MSKQKQRWINLILSQRRAQAKVTNLKDQLLYTDQKRDRYATAFVATAALYCLKAMYLCLRGTSDCNSSANTATQITVSAPLDPVCEQDNADSFSSVPNELLLITCGITGLAVLFKSLQRFQLSREYDRYSELFTQNNAEITKAQKTNAQRTQANT